MIATDWHKALLHPDRKSMNSDKSDLTKLPLIHLKYANFASRSLYDESIHLIRLIEDRLAKRWSFVPERIHWALWVPAKLMVRGFEQLIRDVSRLLLVILILSGILSLTGSHAAWVRDALIWIQYGVILLTVFMLVFPSPSAYCSAGINDKHVGTVRDQFTNWTELSPKRIDLVAKNVRLFEERTRRRMTIFRWILGVSWAALSPLTGEVLKAATASPPRAIDIAPLLPSLIWLGLAFLVVEAYAKGLDIVFRSIELGCHEALAGIDRDERLKTELAASESPSS